MDKRPSYSVLQVLPALEAGGVERTTLEIAEALIAQGHAAHVVSAGGRLVPELTAMGASHYRMEVGRKNPLSLPWRIAALRRLIDHVGADVVHARSRAPAWAAWRAAIAQGVPFVTTYHGIYNEGFPGKRRYNSVMARGDIVIANSQFTADHIQRVHRVPERRIRVIPRGVDMAAFDPARIKTEAIKAMRARWDVGDAQRLVLLPARLTRWKGQTVAIEALAALPDGHVLVCLGDSQGRDAYVEELRQRAETLGVAHRLRLPGHEADMAAAYAAADLVITPSVEPEAFGRTAAEAQAMGRWVVASALGGALETVADGVTGMLVPPGDAAALARAILSAPPAHDADAARQRISARFSKAALQRATLGVYEELLSGA